MKRRLLYDCIGSFSWLLYLVGVTVFILLEMPVKNFFWVLFKIILVFVYSGLAVFQLSFFLKRVKEYREHSFKELASKLGVKIGT